MCLALSFSIYRDRSAVFFKRAVRRQQLPINTDDLTQLAALHHTPIIEFLEIRPVGEERLDLNNRA